MKLTAVFMFLLFGNCILVSKQSAMKCKSKPLSFSKDHWIKKFNATEDENGFITSYVAWNEFKTTGYGHFASVYDTDIFLPFRKWTTNAIAHFYRGDSATYHLINDDTGKYTTKTLGYSTNEFFVPIPKNTWYAVEMKDDMIADYILTGITHLFKGHNTTMTLSGRNEMLLKFPQHEDVVTTFTKPNVPSFVVDFANYPYLVDMK